MFVCVFTCRCAFCCFVFVVGLFGFGRAEAVVRGVICVFWMSLFNDSLLCWFSLLLFAL